MAKKKIKSSKGAESSKQQENLNLPSFDETALSALTARIEKGLDNKQPDTSSGKSRPTSKHPTPIARGVKRDASGNAKSTTNPKAANGTNKKDKKDKTDMKQGNGENKREILLQEILALGGTAEDLDLVGDAPSDEDGEYDEISTSVDKSFKRDLARFVEGLGIEGSGEKDLAEEPVEESEEDQDTVEDEWEASELGSFDDDVSVIEDGPITKLPVQSRTIQEKQALSDPNRLVSIPHMQEEFV